MTNISVETPFFPQWERLKTFFFIVHWFSLTISFTVVPSWFSFLNNISVLKCVLCKFLENGLFRTLTFFNIFFANRYVLTSWTIIRRRREILSIFFIICQRKLGNTQFRCTDLTFFSSGLKNISKSYCPQKFILFGMPKNFLFTKVFFVHWL